MMKCYGEIWLAFVQFENFEKEIYNKKAVCGKRRPVIIVKNKGVCYDVLEITSKPPVVFGDFALVDWDIAGLKCVSTVKTGKIRQLYNQVFVHKIGNLSFVDIKTVEYYLNHRIEKYSIDNYSHDKSSKNNNIWYIVFLLLFLVFIFWMFFKFYH